MDGIIEQMKQLVNEFDFANFIPAVDSILGWIELLVRLFVMAAPVCILVFGLWFLFLPPKEANHRAGYRTYFGMGSVEAWRFTQFLAGVVWSAVGLILSVVMLLVTNGYREMDMMDMVNNAIVCVLWEIGCIVLCCLGINITALVMFDRKGVRRSKKRRK
jgi:uncharacterized membrane protein YedE/YeeE